MPPKAKPSAVPAIPKPKQVRPASAMVGLGAANRGKFDDELWTNPTPDTTTEARYWGNLALRLTKNISQGKIERMTIKDRMQAASIAKSQQQIVKGTPETHVNFSKRQTMEESLNALLAEGQRRQRERMTIDITGTTI